MKREPYMVVEGKGVRIPIYEAKVTAKGRVYNSFLLSFYRAGDRQQERAKSIEAAKARAKKLIDELASGTVHVETLSPAKMANLESALGMLGEIDTPLLNAVRDYTEAHKILGGNSIVEAAKFYADHLAQNSRQIVPITFPELVEKVLADIRQDKSKRYIYDMQARLGTLAKKMTGQLRNIRAETIDEVIGGMKVSGRTKNNFRTCLISAFSFASDKGYLPRDAKTEAEYSKRYKVADHGIGIYTPKEMKILLSTVHPRLVPFVVLGGFAGMRSAEIARARWETVHWKSKAIEITPKQAKTASRRLIPIQPVLARWLKPYAKNSGPILPGLQDPFHLSRTLRKAVREIAFPLVHNGLRHSFCSYRYAVLKNAGAVSEEAGNSPTILFKNYREVSTIKEGKKFLVDERSGQEWFSLKPSPARLREIREFLSKQIPL